MAKVDDCGIYKITSPSGKIYIGQTTSIKRRFNQYKKDSPGNRYQRKLYNSFQKYGINNHIFKVIEYIDFTQLYIRERFWQDYYQVIDRDKGLNLILTKTDILPSRMSQETKDRISKALIGKGIGKALTLEHRSKISKANTGYIMPQSQKDKISKSLKFKNSKKLIDIETKQIYLSVSDAATKLNIKYGTLRAMLNGQNMNKTKLRVL